MRRLSFRVRRSPTDDSDANESQFTGNSLSERLTRYVVPADRVDRDTSVRQYPAWEIVFQGADRAGAR